MSLRTRAVMKQQHLCTSLQSSAYGNNAAKQPAYHNLTFPFMCSWCKYLECSFKNFPVKTGRAFQRRSPATCEVVWSVFFPTPTILMYYPGTRRREISKETEIEIEFGEEKKITKSKWILRNHFGYKVEMNSYAILLKCYYNE